MTIQETLYAVLTADGVITGLVSDRIYPNAIPPHDTPPPWIYYTVPDERTTDGAGELTDGSEYTVEFDLFAEDYQTVADLKTVVKNLLNGLRGGQVERCLFRSGTEEPIEDGYHGTLTFGVWGSAAPIVPTTFGRPRVEVREDGIYLDGAIAAGVGTQGPQGIPGPSSVTGSTATTLSGLLHGNGGVIEAIPVFYSTVGPSLGFEINVSFPTAAPGTNSTLVATTAFVSAAIAGRQPIDPTLTALASVSTAADQLIYATGADAFAAAPLTAFARSVLDDTSAEIARKTLGADLIDAERFLPGAPSAGQTVLRYTAPRGMTLDLASAVGTAGSAATSTAVLAVSVAASGTASPVQVGTLTFAGAGKVAAPAAADIAWVPAGGVVSVTAPNPADATLADVSVTLVLSRTGGPAPVGLTAARDWYTGFTAEWSAASGATSYDFRYSGNGGGSWVTQTGLTLTAAAVGGIAVGDYLVQVRAVYPSGVSPWSQVAVNVWNVSATGLLMGAFDVPLCRSLGKLWQNIGKTVAAEAHGDPVRVVTCPYTGTDFACASDGVRGILKLDGSRWYIETDGSVNAYQATLSVPTAPQSVAGLRFTRSTPITTDVPIQFGTATGTRENVGFRANGNTTVQFVYPGPAGITSGTVTALSGRDAVFTVSAGTSGMQVWDGGVSKGTSGVSPYAGNGVVRPLNRFLGRTYSTVCFSGTNSADDRALSEQHAAFRSGVTL